MLALVGDSNLSPHGKPLDYEYYLEIYGLENLILGMVDYRMKTISEYQTSNID